MSSNFDVKMSRDCGSYYLSTTHNGYQRTSMSIESADQMRQIAAALLAKAEEIDSNEKNNVGKPVESLGELLRELELKCAELGKCEAASQIIKCPIYLPDGISLQEEMNIIQEDIDTIKKEIMT